MSVPSSLILKHTGYTVSGTATIEMWGGGKGLIEMKECFISKEKLTRSTLLGCINDNGFGCESIVAVTMDIYDNYGNVVDIYRHSIEFDNKACKMYHEYFFIGIKGI